MVIASPKGVFDILPGSDEPWKDSSIWQHVERSCREVARLYGFLEARTPAFERTELFTRGVGETTDIVSKEMYTFEDKGGRSISLRPEGTAPLIRALLTSGQQLSGLQKLFYIGPMWRYERQQAGRYRQHHQFGVEAIGDPSPERDAELMDLLMSLFQRLGLTGLKLMINSIGDLEDRVAYKKALINYLTPKRSQLSEDSQRRLELNPLRILDSKDAADQEILQGCPTIFEYLSEGSRAHFVEVQHVLERLAVPFSVEPRLVRGLDYYTRTVFEITAPQLGAQNSLGGGGRYDQLIQQLGGPASPALGFGVGLERVIQTMCAQEVELPEPPRPKLLLLPIGGGARHAAFGLLKRLRQGGVATEIELIEGKLKAALRKAASSQIPFVAVIGDEELAKGSCELKEMATHKSLTVRLEDLGNHV